MKDVIIIQNPVGLDRAIQDLQIELSNKITWIDSIYGRSYSRDRIPYVYTQKKEYLEIFPNDNQKSFCFFYVNPIISNVQEGNTNLIIHQKAIVSIIFFVDLKKCFNLIHRADENAINNIISIMNKFHSRYATWYLKNTIRTVEKVYNQYNYNWNNSLIDDEPYTVFSLEFDCIFNNYIVC